MMSSAEKSVERGGLVESQRRTGTEKTRGWERDSNQSKVRSTNIRQLKKGLGDAFVLQWEVIMAFVDW